MRQASNEALVMEYRPLVRQIAQHLKSKMPKADLEDLEQVGMVGLFQAASRYRATEGTTLKTFIGYRIRGAMLDSMRQGDWAPRSVNRAARDIAKAIRAIENQKNRPAREVEIAERLVVSVEAYRGLLTETASRHVFSFQEAPEAVDVGTSYTAPEDAAEEAQLTSNLEAAIAALPERERLIIEATFFGEATLREIGDQMGVTESRVCQLRSQAVARLKAKLGDHLD